MVGCNGVVGIEEEGFVKDGVVLGGFAVMEDLVRLSKASMEERDGDEEEDSS